MHAQTFLRVVHTTIVTRGALLAVIHATLAVCFESIRSVVFATHAACVDVDGDIVRTRIVGAVSFAP